MKPESSPRTVTEPNLPAKASVAASNSAETPQLMRAPGGDVRSITWKANAGAAWELHRRANQGSVARKPRHIAVMCMQVHDLHGKNAAKVFITPRKNPGKPDFRSLLACFST